VTAAARMDRRRLLSALGGALLWPAIARGDDAAPPCTEDQLARALGDIARARAAVTSLTGPFTQERTIGLLKTKVRSTGTLTLVRPDRLRWELDPPDAVTYWVTPEGLGYKSASSQGHASAGGAKIAAALADLRALLGGDLGDLRTRYDLRAACAEPVVFEAVPKVAPPGAAAGPASALQRIVFTLAPDHVSPLTVTLVETARDRTEIQFGAMTKNVAIEPARMRPPS
jgi:outer membrane lipoprotein-sorting protein